MDFQTEVHRLAEAKQSLADLNKQYSKALMDIAVAKGNAKRIEEDLREAALDWFLETGDRAPHDALSIKNHTKTTYNTRQNVALALEKAPMVLTIDPERLDLVMTQFAYSLRDFKTHDDGFSGLVADSIARTVLDLLEIDESAMKALVKEGRAEWAVPIEEIVPTVHMSSRLGQYLITGA